MREPPVDRHAVAVLGDEILVAVVLHQPRDAVEREVPGYALELVGAGLADLRIERAGLRVHEFEQCRALRAERAAVGRMIGIAFDMNDFGLLALRQIAVRVHDDAAAHRAIGAGVAGLGGAQELPGADRTLRRPSRCRRSRVRQASCRQTPAPAPTHKLAPRNFHVHGTVLLSIFAPPGDALRTTLTSCRPADFRD